MGSYERRRAKASLRYYEAMLLFDSVEAAKGWDAMVQHVQQILDKHGCKVVKLERWDDRKLAYDIGPVKRGTYLLVYFQGTQGAIVGIKRDAELSESIVRILLLEDERVLEKIKEREERKKKEEEMRAAGVLPEGAGPGGFEGDREGRYGDRGGDRFGGERSGDRWRGGGATRTVPQAAPPAAPPATSSEAPEAK